MARKGSNNHLKVSAVAWNIALNDINSRFDKLEKQISELSKKADKKVSVQAWNRTNSELNKKFGSKVSVSAWETSLEDQDKQFNELALTELKELDDRLDRTVELISKLTTHLNERVTVSAWDRLCESNENVIDRVDVLRNNTDDFLKRLTQIEAVIRNAKVSEKELKKLLESI